jgi:hypothetical protein
MGLRLELKVAAGTFERAGSGAELPKKHQRMLRTIKKKSPIH